MKKHAILIVEDDRELSEQYTMYCNLAVSNLKNTGLELDIDIVQSFTIADAMAMCDTYHVDFMSLDLALKEDESKLSDSDRKQGREAGGMTLLKSLRDNNDKTNIIIVSGESLMSYSIDALQKYGVLGFYQKGEMDIQQYIGAVQAALWYQSALEMLSRLERFESTPEHVEKVENFWKKALETATTAKINSNGFASLEARLVSIRSKLDKDTGLPANEWVEKALIKKVLRHTDWSLLQVEVTNLSAFESAHASQVAPLSYYLSSQLREISSKFGLVEDVFLGKYRFGHREVFVVIFNPNIKEKGPQIINWLQSDFIKDAPNFTPALSDKPEKVIPRLGVKIWYSGKCEYTDVHQILDALGDDLK